MIKRMWNAFRGIFVPTRDDIELLPIDDSDEVTEPNTALVQRAITEDRTVLLLGPVWLYIRIGKGEEVYWEMPLEAGSLLHLSQVRKDGRYSQAVIHRFNEGEN